MEEINISQKEYNITGDVNYSAIVYGVQKARTLTKYTGLIRVSESLNNNWEGGGNRLYLKM